jgi:predicted Rossmann fold nucleotide-binding protein DprA/Smf involved in DNA uptake
VPRHAHPGPDGPARAYCEAEEVRPQRPYLDRNRDIVAASDVLIACPKGPEQRRSGTWSTVRYARQARLPILIVWPDGEVSDDAIA